MSNQPEILDYLIIGTNINQKGLKVAFAYVDVPQQPFKRNGTPEYKVTVSLTPDEASSLLGLLEPYFQKIDAMYPNSRRKEDYFKPELDRQKNPTGNFLFELKNQFPIKVYDVNNNEVIPAPKVLPGSLVELNFGVLPFEFNGEHGIARTRLYAIKVLELSQRKSPFGEPTGKPVIQSGDPVSPQIPANPAMPQQPNVPQQPAMPAPPNNPAMPQQPSMPANPAMPQQPAMPTPPNNPAMPQQQYAPPAGQQQPQVSGIDIPPPPNFS